MQIQTTHIDTSKDGLLVGFGLELEGMHVSDSKVWSLNEWPVPTMLKKVQLFLGFV